jgi:hypothetical protein
VQRGLCQGPRKEGGADSSHRFDATMRAFVRLQTANTQVDRACQDLANFEATAALVRTDGIDPWRLGQAVRRCWLDYTAAVKANPIARAEAARVWQQTAQARKEARAALTHVEDQFHEARTAAEEARKQLATVLEGMMLEATRGSTSSEDFQRRYAPFVVLETVEALQLGMPTSTTVALAKIGQAEVIQQHEPVQVAYAALMNTWHAVGTAAEAVEVARQAFTSAEEPVRVAQAASRRAEEMVADADAAYCRAQRLYLEVLETLGWLPPRVCAYCQLPMLPGDEHRYHEACEKPGRAENRARIDLYWGGRDCEWCNKV